ncbi:TrpB-like pyridoxal phosphate-dependent enzyme [Lentzea sp. NEAU-D13]|uniref:Tryptophan synthase beta chain n=1 Tax=Lentzea alba TaxID=2714351 RepID=A0A7C9VR85_9PSEU|nr:TrpB-like pyridoxal phosphate-dependent enzyme [Lentzea alba]NGY62434.1 TrpB-like pyridoxal phosphate-dependent enzyme [Lentzea alba]
MIRKVVLSENDLPDRWYNIVADLPSELPPALHPRTLAPLAPDDLLPLLPSGVVEQEFSRERWIEIPDQVRDLYRIWRPSPMYRATRLERALDTPARIYFKYEGVSPAGSHKPNTAVPQAYYAKQDNVKRLTSETGAGQWGSALSFAGSLFGLDVTVYMVRSSYDQKPYRKMLMSTWGADVHPSPSDRTESGRAALAADPDSPGSIGVAISEAVQDALSRDDTRFALGSISNNVLLHQTVIGLEARKQLEIFDDYPDVVIGCVGGGSGYAGLAYPFLRDRLAGHRTGTRFVAVEPDACPSLTRGAYAYDYPDTASLGPVLPMYTLGHNFMPAPIHAGGLRHHGSSPTMGVLVEHGLIQARSYAQRDIFSAAVTFARNEGFVMAPESAHGVRGAIDEALAAREAGEERVILTHVSGHGHFDMAAYESYLAGTLDDHQPSQEQITAALAELPAAAALV